MDVGLLHVLSLHITVADLNFSAGTDSCTKTAANEMKKASNIGRWSAPPLRRLYSAAKSLSSDRQRVSAIKQSQCTLQPKFECYQAISVYSLQPFYFTLAAWIVP